MQVIDAATAQHLRQGQHGGADDDGRQVLPRQVLRQIDVGRVADHGGAAAAPISPAEAAQIGDAVAVVQHLAVASVGDAQCFDTDLGQGEQLTGIGHTVLVQIAPQAQVGKVRIGGVDPAVGVGVFLGQRVEAVDGIAAEGQRCGIAKQLAAAVDEAVAVAVQREESVIGLDPAGAHAHAGTGGVEIDVAAGVVRARGLDAIAIEVEHQRIPAVGQLVGIGVAWVGGVGFVFFQRDAQVAVGPLRDDQRGVGRTLFDDQRVAVERVANVVGLVGVDIARAFAVALGQQHAVEAHIALAVGVFDRAADLDDVLVLALAAEHLVMLVTEQAVVAATTDEDVLSQAGATQDVVTKVAEKHVVAVVAVKAISAFAAHQKAAAANSAVGLQTRGLLRRNHPFVGCQESGQIDCVRATLDAVDPDAVLDEVNQRPDAAGIADSRRDSRDINGNRACTLCEYRIDRCCVGGLGHEVRDGAPEEACDKDLAVVLEACAAAKGVELRDRLFTERDVCSDLVYIVEKALEQVALA